MESCKGATCKAPPHPFGLVRVDLRVTPPHISKSNESYVKEKSGHEGTNEPCSKRQGFFFFFSQFYDIKNFTIFVQKNKKAAAKDF
jgi:hypothetical protein